MLRAALTRPVKISGCSRLKATLKDARWEPLFFGRKLEPWLAAPELQACRYLI